METLDDIASASKRLRRDFNLRRRGPEGLRWLRWDHSSLSAGVYRVQPVTPATSIGGAILLWAMIPSSFALFSSRRWLVRMRK